MSFHALSRPYGTSTNSGDCGTCSSNGGNTANTVTTMSANPMNFTENQQGNVVLEKLRQQRESGRFCDVVLVVRDRQFPAHRNILAACSPYFDSILRMHKVVKELVTVTCQSADVFELLLNYMYSGNVVIDRNNVTELLKLAHNFLVSKLKNYCAEYLDRYLDTQTCLCVKELAEKYNMPGLAKNATHFIETNINTVLLESQDLLEYPICRAQAIISEKTFPHVTFDSQLRFVTRYVHHQLEERECHFTTLLSSTSSNVHGRHVAADSPTLFDWIDREQLFHKKPSLLLLLVQYARDNGLRGLYGRCERLYQSLTMPTGGTIGDVSIYFNNGHSEGDQDADLASLTTTAMIQGNDPISERITDATTSIQGPNFNVDPMCHSEDGRVPSDMAMVKQEPPETPPSPGNVALSISGSISTGPQDVPPLRIRLRLNERSSTTKEDGKDKRKAANRMRLALSENGEIDNPEYVVGHSSRRKRHSRSHWEWTTQPEECRGIITEDGVPADYAVEPAIMNNPTFEEPLPVSPNEEEEEDSCNEESTYEDTSSSDEKEEDTRDERRAEILFKCPHCIYTSGSQARIQSHQEKAHSKNRTFTCTVCTFECKWNRQYYTHMKEHFQGPPFCCDSCDYIAERIQMLLTHRMKHTDERPFQCKECDYRCRTKTNLVAHMRSHTGEKPFMCPSCCRSFAIKSTLDQHLATHSDARPFTCDQCSFSTKYQSHLISHKRIHSGDVFRCQYPDCTYSSPKKSQLAAHMRTHMAVRTHVCKQCGRSFIEKSHLVRHERIHLQVKPFKCDQCNYASSRRDKLKEHVQKHHIPGAVSNHKAQMGGKNQTGRSGRRSSGRTGRMSFVFGGDGPRYRRSSSGVGGRYSSSLTAGRPHSSMGFRPIGAPINAPSNIIPLSNTVTGSMMDLNSLLASPTCANDSMVPLVTGHPYQPSPFEGAALNDGDVLLSTQTGGLLMTDSPQSTTNSLLSDPFPSAATPASDPLQRPMSLPPLGAQAGLSAGDFNFFE